MPTMSDLVPIKLAQLVLRVVEAQGYDMDEFLADSQISFNPLDEDPKIPTHITADEYNRLYKRIIWLLQDECWPEASKLAHKLKSVVVLVDLNGLLPPLRTISCLIIPV